MRQRILIIGSGAVAAVFAHHLVQAGCQVSFLVRSKKSPNSRTPRTLHQYHFLGSPTPRQQHLRVITQAYRHWDQVWLTLPSDALDSPWLAKQLSVFDSDTPLISWTPDFRDHDTLARLYPGPVQHGLIGLISFHTPLPGQDTPAEGFGYLLPPSSALLDNSRAGRQAAALLRAGGLPARSIKDLNGLAARATAISIPTIAALELSGWSLADLRGSEQLNQSCQASREAMHISAAHQGQTVGMAAKLTRPGLLNMLTLVAPKVMPFPLETYLRYHFSKVGDQTRLMLDHWIEEGQQRNLPTTALQALRKALAAIPPS
jgi:hypothetical protein